MLDRKYMSIAISSANEFLPSLPLISLLTKWKMLSTQFSNSNYVCKLGQNFTVLSRRLNVIFRAGNSLLQRLLLQMTGYPVIAICCLEPRRICYARVTLHFRTLFKISKAAKVAQKSVGQAVSLCMQNLFFSSSQGFVTKEE